MQKNVRNHSLSLCPRMKLYIVVLLALLAVAAANKTEVKPREFLSDWSPVPSYRRQS